MHDLYISFSIVNIKIIFVLLLNYFFLFFYVRKEMFLYQTVRQSGRESETQVIILLRLLPR